MKQYRVGLIVNPIAGMGGAVGLKGTDGDLATAAELLGSKPTAGAKAIKAVAAVGSLAQSIDWLTCTGRMGADVLDQLGLAYTIVCQARNESSTAEDTRSCARAFLEQNAHMILFAGGDGTATNLLEVIGQSVPLLGIPAGVKMHSAVFAVSPRIAGDVLNAYLTAPKNWSLLIDAEVMDRPESEAQGQSPLLLGYVRTPSIPTLVASAKAADTTGSIQGACRYAVESIQKQGSAVLGPGTTMREVKRAFGFEGTLNGVDIVDKGRALALDQSESQILKYLDHSNPYLVISIVGGQGFLFGRGNQQLSATVIRRIGRNRIMVIASTEKLISIPAHRLFVDTGDEVVDACMNGYLPVVVGYRKTIQMPIGPDTAGTVAEPTQSYSSSSSMPISNE